MKIKIVVAAITIVCFQAGVLRTMEDPHKPDQIELTKQLFDTIEKGSVERVQQLIDAGADLTIRHTNSETPLQFATLSKNPLAPNMVHTILTHVPHQKLQHILTALFVFRQPGQYLLPRDVRKLMGTIFIKQLIDEQVALAQKLLLMKNIKGQTSRQAAIFRNTITLDMGFAPEENTTTIIEILNNYMENEDALRAAIEADIRRQLSKPN